MGNDFITLQEKGYKLNNGWRIILQIPNIENHSDKTYAQFYNNNFDNLLEDYKAFADAINTFGLLPDNTSLGADSQTYTLISTTLETVDKIVVLYIE